MCIRDRTTKASTMWPRRAEACRGESRGREATQPSTATKRAARSGVEVTTPVTPSTRRPKTA
eukprot:12978202-Alexandrium_andersonii.AAC.1